MNNRKVEIMGIVNITDDSFFSGSRCLGPDGGVMTSTVLSKVSGMLSDGADIIDIGAFSSAPGTTGVSPGEQFRRLRPAVEAVLEAFGNIRLSIDTTSAEVVERLSRVIPGGFIVNDISAGESDPLMLETVAGLGLDYVAMHMRGTPLTMQSMCDYDDVTAAVSAYFDSFSIKAGDAGLKDWILDPGFGFAKTVEQNYELLRNLGRLKCYGRRILAGLSRKSMIYKPLGITPEQCLSATQVLNFKALENGADILRVHDVAEAVRTVKLWRII